MANGKRQQYSKSRTRGLKPRWKPGESGNPNGRPPNKKYLSEWARQLLKEVPAGEVEGRTADELVTMALIREALKGNTKAIEILHDWTEGKVTIPFDIQGELIKSVVKDYGGDNAKGQGEEDIPA